MNRKSIITLSVVAAGMVVSAIILLFAFSIRVPEEPSAAAPMYSIREYQGQLAIFEQGQETPLRIIDMDIALLPLYDQALLQSGIDAADEQELRRLLEDYTS